MGVVSHSYGGLGGEWMVVVDGMHVGQSQVGWLHVGRCQSTFRARGETRMTPITLPSMYALYNCYHLSVIMFMFQILRIRDCR